MNQQARQLPAGLWSTQCASQEGTSRFGLALGQMRSGTEGRLHNAQWYNALGERVGFGDLNEEDIRRIMAEIDDGCYLVIARERHGMKRPAITPGMETLITHAELVITRGKTWWLHPIESGEQATARSLTFPTLSYDEARRLFLPLQAAEAT